jgi:hypothetical protein
VVGAMVPIVDPAGLARSWGSATELSGCRARGAKAMPPLWQYLLRLLKKALESISAPKGHGPPDCAAFSLQAGRF